MHDLIEWQHSGCRGRLNVHSIVTVNGAWWHMAAFCGERSSYATDRSHRMPLSGQIVCE